MEEPIITAEEDVHESLDITRDNNHKNNSNQSYSSNDSDEQVRRPPRGSDFEDNSDFEEVEDRWLLLKMDSFTFATSLQLNIPIRVKM
jgi:hypothetical protein